MEKRYELFYGSGGHSGPYLGYETARAAIGQALTRERYVLLAECSSSGVSGFDPISLYEKTGETLATARGWDHVTLTGIPPIFRWLLPINDWRV